MGSNSTEEQPSAPGGQDNMWRNEKYESVPLDVKGIDEDNSKGTRDSLYPQTGSAVSHKNRGIIPLHTFRSFNFRKKEILPVPLMFSRLSSTS